MISWEKQQNFWDLKTLTNSNSSVRYSASFYSNYNRILIQILNSSEFKNINCLQKRSPFRFVSEPCKFVLRSHYSLKLNKFCFFFFSFLMKENLLENCNLLLNFFLFCEIRTFEVDLSFNFV